MLITSSVTFRKHASIDFSKVLWFLSIKCREESRRDKPLIRGKSQVQHRLGLVKNMECGSSLLVQDFAKTERDASDGNDLLQSRHNDLGRFFAVFQGFLDMRKDLQAAIVRFIKFAFDLKSTKKSDKAVNFPSNGTSSARSDAELWTYFLMISLDL
jgi:hypothetical protein